MTESGAGSSASFRNATAETATTQQGASSNGSSNGSSPSSDTKTHAVAVKKSDVWHDLEVEHGRSLRAVLRENKLSPHGWLTQHLNCDGQGHCSACAVEVDVGAEEPDQWLDRFLDENGAGRLSCQITVTQDMSVRV